MCQNQVIPLQAPDRHSPGFGNVPCRGGASKVAKYAIKAKRDWQSITHRTTLCGSAAQIEYPQRGLSFQALAKPLIDYHTVLALRLGFLFYGCQHLLLTATVISLFSWRSVWKVYLQGGLRRISMLTLLLRKESSRRKRKKLRPDMLSLLAGNTATRSRRIQ